MDENHSVVIKNNAVETGYPQLCKGILWLSYDDSKKWQIMCINNFIALHYLNNCK
jgi:hypothetical protein